MLCFTVLRVNEFENDKWEMVEEFAEEREALRKEVEDVKKQLEEMRLKLVEQKQQNALAEDTQEVSRKFLVDLMRIRC